MMTLQAHNVLCVDLVCFCFDVVAAGPCVIQCTNTQPSGLLNGHATPPTPSNVRRVRVGADIVEYCTKPGIVGAHKVSANL